MMRYSLQKNFLWVPVFCLLASCAIVRCDEEDGPPATVTEADATAGKPILLIGGKYGHYDRDAIRDEILVPRKLTYEDGGDWNSAENWKNYSLVILANSFPETVSDQEHGWIRDYLTNGGRLLMLGPTLVQLRQRANAPLDWLGAGGYQLVKEGAISVTPAGAKYAEDAKGAVALLEAANVAGPQKLSTAQPLIVRGDTSIAFRNVFGKGEVFYFGFDYFRLALTIKDKAQKAAARAPVRQILEKLIMVGDTQTKTDAIARGLREYGAAQPVVWRRDFAGARGAEYASPPYPKHGEGLQHLHLDLGIGEWESIPLYVSSPVPAPNFEVRIDDLKDKTGGRNIVPASSLHLRMQGLARADLTVGPYWLLDLTRRDATGNSTWRAPLQAAFSQTLWLTLSTAGLPAGLYETSIQFKNPDIPAVQLEIKVWPVSLPGREYFEAEATSLWNGLLTAPGQPNYSYPDPPMNLARFDLHIADLSAHHIAFNMDSSWINPYGRSFSLKNVRLRENSAPFETACKQGLIKEDKLPELDFSYFDPFVENAVVSGLPYFHFNFKNLPGNWLAYAKEITGDANLEPDSPRHEKIKKWLLSQCVQYLRSKGIQKIVAFLADEIPPDKIPDATRRARLLHECGIRVEFSATGQTGQSREYIAQMNPAIDRWIWNVAVLPQAKALVRSANAPVDKSDEEYTYVADWHRASYVFNRSRGPFCAWNDLDGLFIHGYLRWYPNGGAVFSGPDGPIDTEGWEGARDGIEDARYWKRLAFLLAAAKKRPDLSAGVKTIEEKMARWVAASPQSLVRLEDRTYHIYRFQEPVSSYEALQRLKTELLESLSWLQEKVSTRSTLQYAGQPLVHGGKIVADLKGDPAAVKALQTVLAHRLEEPLSPASTTNTRVVLGTRTQVELSAPETAKTMTSPKAGHFSIGASGAVIVVCGGDAEGLTKGAQALAVLCERSETIE